MIEPVEITVDGQRYEIRSAKTFEGFAVAVFDAQSRMVSGEYTVTDETRYDVAHKGYGSAVAILRDWAERDVRSHVKKQAEQKAATQKTVAEFNQHGPRFSEENS